MICYNNKIMEEHNKPPKVQYRSIVEEKENTVQHRAKGERRFFEELFRNEYKSPLSFIFAYFGALLCIFLLNLILNLVFLGLSLMQEGETFFVFVLLIPILIIPLIFVILGIKILRRLLVIYKIKDKKFKTQTLWILILGTALLVYISVKFISASYSLMFATN